MTNQQADEQISKLLLAAEKTEEQGQTEQAIEFYENIYALIPEPKEMSELTTMILTRLGEIRFLNRQWDAAFHDFADAVKCKDGLGNPHIHLRLGQLQLERGNLERATDELMRAYMGGGNELFVSEDPKYLRIIAPYL